MMATKTAKRKSVLQTRNIGEHAAKIMLAAAIGDALGWPNEARARARRQSGTSIGFKQWERNAGGRYYPHVEIINTGAYSDDTQLILATARSLINAGTSWFAHFTGVEIPLWRYYERGGGGALLRAANQWLNGTAPWKANDPSQLEAYFSAGGNGGAMRILPHCLRRQNDPDFTALANDVARNTLATHAHPRAVVGALVYAYALWSALKQKRPLKFGRLVPIVRESLNLIVDPPNALFDELEITTPPSYRSLWTQTLDEVRNYLNIADNALAQGAVFVEQETLQKIGATSPHTNGAGTVAAASAIFLSSRYASDPEQGVIEAAYAQGADTDTIASMTGALLACFADNDWIERYKKQLQDHAYLASVANRLMSDTLDTVQCTRVTSSDMNKFRDSLECLKPGDSVALPDGQKATLSERSMLATNARIEVTEYAIQTRAGQSLFFKRINKPPLETKVQAKVQDLRTSEHAPLFDESETFPEPFVHSAQTIILCTDLKRSMRFYNNILGLRVWSDSRPRANAVVLDGAIMLFQSASAEKGGGTRLRFRTRFLQQIFNALQKSNFVVKARAVPVEDLKSIEARDPDGNIVELVEDNR